jgi:hypothetical protein
MEGKRFLGRTGRRSAPAFIAATLTFGVALSVPGVAFARAKSGSASGSTSGTCSESPNPVALGALYTVTGAHLPAGQIVSVSVTDPKGTQWGSTLTTATGTLTFVGQAAVAGSYSVRITGGSKGSLLATCGFRTA